MVTPKAHDAHPETLSKYIIHHVPWYHGLSVASVVHVVHNGTDNGRWDLQLVRE